MSSRWIGIEAVIDTCEVAIYSSLDLYFSFDLVSGEAECGIHVVLASTQHKNRSFPTFEM